MYVVLSGNLVVSKAGKQVAVGRPGRLLRRDGPHRAARAVGDPARPRRHARARDPGGRLPASTSPRNPAALMALLRVFSERSRHDLDGLVSANLKLLAQAEEMDRKNRELDRDPAPARAPQPRPRAASPPSTRSPRSPTAGASTRCCARSGAACARDESPLSLVFCDIDYFKRFNDTYGHQAGDECLVRVAQAMEETLNRPADLVARYGGEEFIALLVDTDVEGARMLAERMRARVEALRDRAPRLRRGAVPDGQPGRRHGRAPSPRSGPEDLVDLADRALYAAKAGGRNRCRRLAGSAGRPSRERRRSSAESARAAQHHRKSSIFAFARAGALERRLDLGGLALAHRLLHLAAARSRSSAARRHRGGPKPCGLASKAARASASGTGQSLHSWRASAATVCWTRSSALNDCGSVPCSERKSAHSASSACSRAAGRSSSPRRACRPDPARERLLQQQLAVT